jgi:hypothetical protein
VAAPQPGAVTSGSRGTATRWCRSRLARTRRRVRRHNIIRRPRRGTVTFFCWARKRRVRTAWASRPRRLVCADRPRAGRDIAPPAHSRRRNRSGRGRSSCRSAPERGNAHTRRAGLAFPPAQARSHMDGVGTTGSHRQPAPHQPAAPAGVSIRPVRPRGSFGGAVAGPNFRLTC